MYIIDVGKINNGSSTTSPIRSETSRSVNPSSTNQIKIMASIAAGFRSCHSLHLRESHSVWIIAVSVSLFFPDFASRRMDVFVSFDAVSSHLSLFC
jgi:hypothetical protein